MWVRARTIAQIVFLVIVVAWISAGQFYYKQTPYYTKYEPKTEAKNVFESEKADERIARYNFWLTVFTGLLFAVASIQIYFLTRADITARKAANTAEKALTQLERPYIFIWQMLGAEPTITFSGSDNPQKTIQGARLHAIFYYKVSNRGKLAAVIENVSIACGYENQPRHRYPPLTIIGDHYFMQSPLLSAEADSPNLNHAVLWSYLDRTSQTFKDGLIFRVVVSYRGLFTKGHETSQCWRYQQSVHGFAEVDDPSVTYAR